MKLFAKSIAAALVSVAVPLAGSAVAAPLSQPLMLMTTDVPAVEQVQYGNWRGYGDGYGAYAAVPGYDSSGTVGRYRNFNRNYGNPNFGNGGAAAGPESAPGCTSDRYQNSGFPSWYCN